MFTVGLFLFTAFYLYLWQIYIREKQKRHK